MNTIFAEIKLIFQKRFHFFQYFIRFTAFYEEQHAYFCISLFFDTQIANFNT